MLPNQPKWLALLIIAMAVALFAGGCPSTIQPPTYQPPPNQPAAVQPPASQSPVSQPPSYLPQSNRPPVIDSLTCQWRQVKESMSVPIDCAASDPDGDELSYSWSVDGGTITGEGAVGDWITSRKYGVYTITVTVSDGRGGQDTASLEISVRCCLKEVGE
jgi:hypothetical protein